MVFCVLLRFHVVSQSDRKGQLRYARDVRIQLMMRLFWPSVKNSGQSEYDIIFSSDGVNERLEHPSSPVPSQLHALSQLLLSAGVSHKRSPVTGQFQQLFP